MSYNCAMKDSIIMNKRQKHLGNAWEQLFDEMQNGDRATRHICSRTKLISCVKFLSVGLVIFSITAIATYFWAVSTGFSRIEHGVVEIKGAGSIFSGRSFIFSIDSQEL